MLQNTSMRSFESLVNTEGFQTMVYLQRLHERFESLVNTEGFQTPYLMWQYSYQFESLVNTEGFQTSHLYNVSCARLRVLLIQKDFKRTVL